MQPVQDATIASRDRKSSAFTYITISERGRGTGSKFLKKMHLSAERYVHIQPIAHVHLYMHIPVHIEYPKQVHRRKPFLLHRLNVSKPRSLTLSDNQQTSIFYREREREREIKWPMNACCWDRGLSSTLKKIKKQKKVTAFAANEIPKI